MRTHTDSERVQRDEDRSTQRIKSICEMAIVAIVTESGTSYAEAAGMLLTETARNMTPAGVKKSLALK